MGEDELLLAARMSSDPTSDLVLAKLRRNLFDKDEIPAKIGPYELLERLGAGAMGTVFEARDPVLDRRVAVKLLNPRENADIQTLLAEARALAQLAHPNVVTVHDAGTFRRQVYIVMELLEGEDVGRWMERGPHPIDEVVAIFAQAAAGLAAAHDAAIVHGDFKPANVLMAGERVCVADFGMARRTRNSEDDRSLDERATSVGGTPMFMSPQRLQGRDPTPRSDQFAFSVSLFWAVYGHPPFRGETTEDLVDQMRRPPTMRASDRPAPRWLHDMIVKGLEPEPSRRHPSMDEVARLLSRPRAAIRRRRLVAFASLVTVGLAAGWIGRTSRVDGPLPPCHGLEQGWSEVWSTERQAALRAAFEASGLPFAADSFERTSANLDRFGERWVEARTRACRATRVEGTQSEDMLDRRVECLDRQLARAESLLDALSFADEKTVTAAIRTTSELDAVDQCADNEALRRATPPPDDPAARDEVRALEAILRDINAHYTLARVDGLAEQLDAIEGRVDALAYPPVTAQFLALRGGLADGEGEQSAVRVHLKAAFREAVIAGDLRHASRLSTTIARSFRISGREDEVLEWLQMGKDLVRGVRDDGRARASFLLDAADIHHIEGRHDEAARCNRAAAEFWEGVDPHHIQRVRALTGLGKNLREQGELRDAAQILDEAASLARVTLGPEHPQTAQLDLELATTHVYAGDYAEALAAADEALAVATELWGQTARTAPFLNGRAMALVGLERLSQAEATYQQAHESYAATHGEDHYNNGVFMMNLSGVQADAGRYGDAIVSAREAVRVLRLHLDDDNPTVVNALVQLALSQERNGDAAQAVATLDAAEAAGHLGKLRPARQSQARFTLARALYASAADDPAARQRAVTLAKSARALLEGGIAHAESRRASIDEWLAGHP